MKTYIIIILSFLIYTNTNFACSMYKITMDGKTIVGNNEDWHSPNTQMWFVNGEESEYGVMNIGLIDGFAQGAINEAGLMFDGFGMPYLAINNMEGKTQMPIGQAMQNIMHTSSNVKEVKDYLSKIDLSSLTTGMVVFVDRTGDYLIVEGEGLILGNDAEQSFSNFYPSQTSCTSDVDLPYYQNGINFQEKYEANFSMDYCSAVMENFSQATVSKPSSVSKTQYTTVYDLENLIIQVYLFNNFEECVEIDLKEYLQKGNQTLSIPDLFSKTSEGYLFFQNYNNENDPASFLKALLERERYERKGEDLEALKNGFPHLLNAIAYEWLYDKRDAKGAIAIFKFGINAFPDNANLYDSLAEALHENGEGELAISNYEKSLELNPENENAKEMIKNIKQAMN